MSSTTRKTILVKYKNIDGNYENESKLPFIEIHANKYNPQYHKKLFWRNIYKDSVECAKWIDWQNPWIVWIGTGLVVWIILYLLIWK